MTETSNQPNTNENTTDQTSPNEAPVNENPAEPTVESKEDFDQALLEAFVQKPSKIDYYQKAIRKMMVTGSPNLQWHWSWWGFFGGWAFLLYRKAYLAALITFLITSAISFIPFGGIASMIVLGGIAPYFIVKRYATLKQQVENRYQTEEEKLDAMRKVGGYHNWVAWAAGIFYALVFLTVLIITLFDPMGVGHH